MSSCSDDDPRLDDTEGAIDNLLINLNHLRSRVVELERVNQDLEYRMRTLENVVGFVEL
jgi:hypothetical protein